MPNGPEIVMVLVSGLSRSKVSCLTVSDRSTIPVVILVLRDLKKKSVICVEFKI